jgi:hypothetical protein
MAAKDQEQFLKLNPFAQWAVEHAKSDPMQAQVYATLAVAFDAWRGRP